MRWSIRRREVDVAANCRSRRWIVCAPAELSWKSSKLLRPRKRREIVRRRLCARLSQIHCRRRRRDIVRDRERTVSEAADPEAPTLAFLPLGTGNSFLRDFSDSGVEFAIDAMLARRSRPATCCDSVTKTGVHPLHQSLECGLRRRRGDHAVPPFQRLGGARISAVHFHLLGRFRRRPFPLRVDGESDIDRRPCLFLTFNNSKYTGGTMMIAPKAEDR